MRWRQERKGGAEVWLSSRGLTYMCEALVQSLVPYKEKKNGRDTKNKKLEQR